MTEDIQDSIGGCSPYDKLLVTCSLSIVKPFGGKKYTQIVVRASPQGREKVTYFRTPVNESHKCCIVAGRESGFRCVDSACLLHLQPAPPPIVIGAIT